MTDDIINQAINEAITEAPAEVVADKPIETKQEAPTEEVNPEPNEPVDVPFPKKAVNLISRKDKKIWKLQADLAAERAELQKYREAEAQKANQAPAEEQFENYGEFLEAKILHKLNQDKPKAAQPQNVDNESNEKTQWIQERVSYMDSREKETAAIIPDYTQTINDNLETITGLPEHVRLAILEADAPELVLYTMAKEGSLYDLAEMSERAAMLAIGRAEVRGMSYRKPQTKAPAPIGGLKGTGQSNKVINGQSSYEEIAKWLNS